MQRYFTVLFLTLIALALVAVACGRRNTPERTIEAFLDARVKKDGAAMKQCLSKKALRHNEEIARQEGLPVEKLLVETDFSQFSKLECRNEKIEGDRATLECIMFGDWGTLQFVKEDGDWKIDYGDISASPKPREAEITVAGIERIATFSTITDEPRYVVPRPIKPPKMGKGVAGGVPSDVPGGVPGGGPNPDAARQAPKAYDPTEDEIWRKPRPGNIFIGVRLNLVTEFDIKQAEVTDTAGKTYDTLSQKPLHLLQEPSNRHWKMFLIFEVPEHAQLKKLNLDDRSLDIEQIPITGLKKESPAKRGAQ